jgi:thiaminase
MELLVRRCNDTIPPYTSHLLLHDQERPYVNTLHAMLCVQWYYHELIYALTL